MISKLSSGLAHSRSSANLKDDSGRQVRFNHLYDLLILLTTPIYS